MAEKKLIEVEARMGSVELKLAKAKSLNLSQADELDDLKTALDACEEKWYNEGFVDVENSVEPVVHQARRHGFGEGWLVALQVKGVAKDSPLRNPKQILYPAPHPPIQSQASAVIEEDTPNMRELVHVIDSHAKTVYFEITSNLNATEDTQVQKSLTINQLRVPKSSKPRILPIFCSLIPQFDTYVLACFYFLFMFIHLFYLFGLSKVTGL